MRSSNMGNGSRPDSKKGATSIRLFQKNLRDMITGIRSHKEKQKDFMNKCLQDIRAEVRASTEPREAEAEPVPNHP